MENKIIILYLFLMIKLFNCQSNVPKFKCIHDDYDEKHPLPNLVIKRDDSNKRRIEGESESKDFVDFNIFLDLENVKYDINKNNLSDYENFFISSMQKAVSTLQSLLKVKPLETANGEYYINDETLRKLNLTKWNETAFGDKAISNHNSFQSQGIHLAIFGTLVELPETTLATASAKLYQDGNGQPYVGLVKINKKIDYSKPNSQIYFESILVHEFTHILGFSKHFFETYYKNIEMKTDKYGFNRMYLNSPILLEKARKYFNCPTLEGVELENQGGEGTAGSHWEARILLGEYMNGYSYTEEQVISEFTLAVLEDSGYYKPNYYTGGLMRYGKYKGCAFLEDKCVDSTTHKIKEEFENEFYDTISGSKSIEASCSSGRQSRTYNAWYILSGLPEVFQYFENPNITGYEPADYCPVPLKYQKEEDDYYFVGHCSIIGKDGGYGTMLHNDRKKYKYTSNDTIEYTGEYFSDHSYCYLSSLSTKKEVSDVVRAICYESFCSEKSLTIRIFDDYIVCPRAGGKILVDGYEGYLLCPDYNLICTGTKLCNNIFDCVEKQSEIKEESFNYDYTIKTTQNIEKSNTAEADKTDNYELSEDGQCPQFCKHCKKKNKIFQCLECKEGYGLKLETDNSIKCYDLNTLKEGYYKNGNNVYIKCIENCDKCEDLKTCTKCKEYHRYTSKAECVIIPEEDRDKIIPYCLQTDEDYNCQNCEDGYAFKENNHSKCYNIQTELTNYYRKDNKSLSFLPCSAQIENCNQCYYEKKEYRVKCTHCLEGLVLLMKGKGTCQKKEEIENNTKYYLVNETHASVCSKDIENCVSCTSEYDCTQCKYNYIYDIYENKCISKYQKTKNDEEIDLSDTSIDFFKKENTSSESTSTSSKRRKVKKKVNFSNYFSISNIILLQTIYIIFMIINF